MHIFLLLRPRESTGEFILVFLEQNVRKLIDLLHVCIFDCRLDRSEGYGTVFDRGQRLVEMNLAPGKCCIKIKCLQLSVYVAQPGICSHLCARMLSHHNRNSAITSNWHFAPVPILRWLTRAIYDLSVISEVWLEAIMPIPIGRSHRFVIRMEGLGAFRVGKLEINV